MWEVACRSPSFHPCYIGRAASVGSRPAVLRRREQTRFIVCERTRKAAANKRQPQRAERATYKVRAEAFFPLRATTAAAADFLMFAPPICRRSWAEPKMVV
jgi:hypothetical protein